MEPCLLWAWFYSVTRQTLTPSVSRHWMDKTVTRPRGCQLVLRQWERQEVRSRHG